MRKRREEFIRRGILAPLAIAVIVSVLLFAVYGVLVRYVFFDEREFVFSQYSVSAVKDAEYAEGESGIVRKGDIANIDKNTLIGNAAINGADLSIIYDANEKNQLNRLNLDPDGSFIGENGCAYLYCSKKNSAPIRLMSLDDTVVIDTYYGSFEYKIVYTGIAADDIELGSVADEYGTAVAIYTDASSGVGIGDTYYVVVGELVSGNRVVQ